ncbi:MAG: 50S ribosomal protein L24 [Flavobacterium sp.]|nr:MAG: 50S ribosomal protein L24 [Flavobacterium sp.]
MIKLKIKSGDTVKVIAGDHRGTTGKVTRVYREANKAIVEGVNMVSKHTKPSAKNPQGGIVKKEAPIHISNLAVVDNAKAGSKKESSKKSNKA